VEGWEEPLHPGSMGATLSHNQTQINPNYAPISHDAVLHAQLQAVAGHRRPLRRVP